VTKFFYFLLLFFPFQAFTMDDRPCLPYSSAEEGSVRTIAASSDDYIRFFEDLQNGGDEFCSEWNPEFKFNGEHCCAKRRGAKQRRDKCPSQRRKSNFCDEMTYDQQQFQFAAAQGKLGDVLEYLVNDKEGKKDQAFCDANNGFLAFGKPLIPSPKNRIVLKSEGRCTNFGTNRMISMVEWLGREVGKQFSDNEKVKIMLGDMSAPRGGCLRGSRKGHASHTNGQDADIGFISAKYAQNGRFLGLREFDPDLNWWFLKKVFKNPHACIKVVFLDRRLIQKLFKVARLDGDWNQYSRFIKHARGHHNHFHVRVGNVSGTAGCPGVSPEEEVIDEQDAEVESRADSTNYSGAD
jgi:murein endopeptidase